MKHYTRVPNKIITDSSLNLTELRLLLAMLQKENIPRWKHVIKTYANELGVQERSIHRAIKSLMAKGYIEKGTQHYMLSNALFSENTQNENMTSHVEHERNCSENMTSHAENLTKNIPSHTQHTSNCTENMTSASAHTGNCPENMTFMSAHTSGCIENMTFMSEKHTSRCIENMTFVSGYNNKELINTEFNNLNSSISILRDDDELKIFETRNANSEERDAEKICNDQLPKEQKSESEPKPILKANLPAVSPESKQSESQSDILRDAKFIQFAQSKFPHVQNIIGYLLKGDMTTGKPVYEKLAKEFYGTKNNILDFYWLKKIPYEEATLEKDLPCYQQWLNHIENAKEFGNFIEDNSQGYHRNVRIYFCNWYKYYYQPIKQKEQEKPDETKYVDAEKFKQTIKSFYASFGCSK